MALPKARWEHFVLTLDHAALTATTTIKVYKAPRRMEVLKVEYINVTGLVAHDDNHFALTAQNGATVIAGPRSTDGNGGGSSIAADTFTDVALVASTSARILAEGDVLSVVATEGGTATLPAGKFVVHARWV
jgi:hypothetical protein